jgi:DNA-binding transcriptional LysR family regulator
VHAADAALVLVGHAEALLERAAVAEADLSAAAGTVTGRGRIAGFQSVMLHLAMPAMKALARDAPRLRCELLEAEPEDSLPALALGDVDLVLGDEWQHQPLRLPEGVQRHELLHDPVHLVLPARHPATRRHRDAVPLAELAGEAWTTGHVGMGWDEMTHRTSGIALRAIAEGPVRRAIFAATRAADAARPSTQALLAAVRNAAAAT